MLGIPVVIVVVVVVVVVAVVVGAVGVDAAGVEGDITDGGTTFSTVAVERETIKFYHEYARTISLGKTSNQIFRCDRAVQ